MNVVMLEINGVFFNMTHVAHVTVVPTGYYESSYGKFKFKVVNHLGQETYVYPVDKYTSNEELVEDLRESFRKF